MARCSLSPTLIFSDQLLPLSGKGEFGDGFSILTIAQMSLRNPPDFPQGGKSWGFSEYVNSVFKFRQRVVKGDWFMPPPRWLPQE